MKKFGIALLSFLVLCLLPVFASCNTVEQIYRVKVVEFTEEQIALSIDSQPYKLEVEIQDSVATNQKVTFESSNPNIATVDENGWATATSVGTWVTPVGVGTAVISVKSDDNPKAVTNTCTVNVLPQKQKLKTPTNLHFEENTGQVSWYKVVQDENNNYISDTSTFIPKYLVTLKSGEETTTKTVSTNVLEGLEAGKEYDITVQALGNEYVYENSEVSQSLKVHILSTPTELKITPSIKYSTFNNGDMLNDDATQYTNRSYQLSFVIPQDGGTEPSDYQISFLNGNNEEILDVATKTAINSLISQAQILNKTFIMPIDETLPAGDYYIRVRALSGDTLDAYNSAYTRLAQPIKMLPKPTNLVLTGQEKQMVSWNNVTYANAYKVLIEYKFTSVDTDPTYYATYYVKNNTSSFALDGLKDVNDNEFLTTDYNIFNIYVFALGDDEPTILDSPKSAETARMQLGQVKNVRLNNARNASQDLNIVWNSVANASTYKIDVYNKDDTLTYTQNVSATNFVITTDASFIEVGSNKVVITAISSTNPNYTSGLSSTPFVVTKLATPTLNTTNGLISWQRVDYTDPTQAYKLSYMLGAETITIQLNNQQTTYDFSADVAQSGNYTDFYITACGNVNAAYDNTFIDSNPSSTYTVTKLGLPSKFTVQSGVLNLDDSNFSAFELKVVNNDTQELTNFEYLSTETLNTQLKNILNTLVSNVTYRFSLVGLKPSTQSDNVLYVKSNTQETYVYISDEVKNITSNKGEISWQMPDELYNLVKTVSSGKNVLNPRYLQGLRYLVGNDQNTNYTYVDSVDASGTFNKDAKVVLSGMPQGQNFNVNIQIVFTNAENPAVCILNSATNSKQFTQIASVEITEIIDENGNWILKWPKSSLQNLVYVLDIAHTNKNGEEKTATLEYADIQLDDDYTGNYHTLTLTSALLGYDLDEGVYSVFARAYPLSTDGVYISSYKPQNAFTFTKLTAPTLSVENGIVAWEQPALNAYITYNLKINDTPIYDLTTTSYDVNSYYGEVQVSIQAKSGTSNILSSDWGQSIKISKLDSRQIVIDESKVTKNSITWTYSTSIDVAGTPINIDVPEFMYSVATLTNPNTAIDSGRIQLNSESNNYTYTMPTNASFGAGVYILSISPLAEGITNDESVTGIKGFVNGDVKYIYIYKLDQVNDVALSNNKVNWTATTLSTINGRTLNTSTDVLYNINIDKLSAYTYVVNKGDNDEITKGLFDTTNNLYNYFVKPNDNKYSINLQKQEYTDIKDDGGIIQNIRTTADTSFNYVAAGSTINLMLSATLSTRKVQETGDNATTYYIFDSNPASIKNITLLDAPSVQFVDGKIKWSNMQSNFDRLVFTFVPYNLQSATNEGKTLEAITNETTLQQLTKVVTQTSYVEREYELSKLFDATNSQKYYVLKAQSIGNGNRTISSRQITYYYAITNIEDIVINTDNTTIPNYNGWYIQDGAICWNALDGVSTYDLLFEQVKIDGGNQTIERKQTINIQNNGMSHYSYIPDEKVNINGTFYFSMSATGAVYTQEDTKYNCTIDGNTYLGVYASSKTYDGVANTSAKEVLQQLDRNNSMYVKDGELTWQNLQKEVVTQYNVKINLSNNTESVATMQAAQDTTKDELNIIFSDAQKDTAEYLASVQAVGTTWAGRNQTVPASGLYLTSRYGNNFRYRYINKDDILPQVKDGVFNWSLGVTGLGVWNAVYTVGVTQNDGDDPVWLERQTKQENTLADYSTSAKQNIYAVGVKVVGTDNSKTASGVPMLNSKMSKELYNLQKLPDIANFEASGKQIVINQIGDIVWNCGYSAELDAKGFETSVKISILNGLTQQAVYSTKDSIGIKPLNSSVTYNYEGASYDNAISPIYQFDVNVVGSNQYQKDINNGVTYLSSNAATISAPKFAQVSSFTLQDDVKLNWNADRAVASVYNQDTSSTIVNKPNRYMIEYVDASKFSVDTMQLDNGAEFTMVTFDALKDDELLDNISQFMANGNYIIKLSVYNVEGTIFRSAPVYCEYNNSITIGFGSMFKDVEIIDNLPYFVLDSAQHVKNIYFVADSNIIGASSTVSVTGTTKSIYLYNVLLGANFKLDSNITLNTEYNYNYQGVQKLANSDNIHYTDVSSNEEFNLYGIFDGNNKTISNIMMHNSLHPGLFDEIKVGAVIKNLTLQYSSLELDELRCSYDLEQNITPPSEQVYIGLVANYNYGLVDNCKVIGQSENVVSSNYFKNTNLIVMGMIVGNNTYFVQEDNSIIRGKVANCVNGLNVSSEIETGQNIMLGGIVGLNNGADIINCSNGVKNNNIAIGKLGGYMVGGIAYRNENNALISGCVNRGNINIYAAIADDLTTGGGIVAFNYDANIIGCINRGNVLANSVTGTQAYNRTQLGGIAGCAYSNGAGVSTISNCLQTYDVEPGISIADLSAHTGMDVWQTKYIGYIVGREDGDTITIKDCRYKVYIAEDAEAQSFFAGAISGSGDDSDFASYNILALDSVLDDVNTLNTYSADAEALLSKYNNTRPVFAYGDNSFDLVYVDTTAYAQIDSVTDVTKQISADNAFVIEGFDTTIINYSVEYSSDAGQTYTNTQPTQAGSYLVKVSYYITIDETNYIICQKVYNYTLTE